MPFLFPALLWLLPLAAVPIVLHLLTLHRLKTVELSTYRFLFDSYIQQRRRMQFLEALLAALRTLFLLLVVLMAAGPIFSASAGLFGLGQGPIQVVLLVDCSASMKAGAEGQSTFDRAKAAALVVAKSLREQDTLTLVQVAGPEPKQLYSGYLRAEDADNPASRSAEPDDKKTPGQVVDLLNVTASRGDIYAALLRVFGPDAPSRRNANYFLITDCQASGWREVRDQGLQGVIPPHAPFAVVNVGADDLSNRAVIGDAPTDSRAVVGLPYFFQARVVNTSKTETAEMTLSLIVKDKEAARTALTLKPGETIRRRFAYTPREPGVQRGRFEIAGAAPDRFPDDDRYLFALNVSPRIKAVIVDGQTNDPANKDVNEAYYLNAALSSADRGATTDGKTPEADADAVRPFDVRVVPEAALTAPAPGQPPEALKDADVVVLANCGGLQDAQFDALRTFTADGGGLLIFPGDHVNPQIYNEHFFPVPGPQGERLTAARLDAPEGDPDKRDSYEQLGKIDFGRPALALFDDPDAATRPLSSFQVYKRFKLILPKEKDNTWALAWFSSGAPALVESRLGDGDVILSAFPAHTRWTSLPTRPDFTPFLMQLAGHAARRSAVDAPTVVLADGEANFKVDRQWGEVKAEVKKPPLSAAGAEKPVEVKFERRGPRLFGSFKETSRPGYYTLDVKSTTPTQGASAERTFAVNISPEESDFERVNADQIRQLLPSANVTWFDHPKDQEKLTKYLQGGGWGLDSGWWIALLLVIFANEFFLATRGGRRKKAEAEDDAGGERVHQARAGSWAGGMAGAARRP
jgi:hypothetical protein